jgi:hypothetical protein
MHQLTIAAGGLQTSTHADFQQAHRALLDFAIRVDYYLHPVQTGTAHASYELVDLRDADTDTDTADPKPRARITGIATIEAVHGGRGRAIETPYYSASAAAQWIADAAVHWAAGRQDEPGAGYPLSVLRAAHAEAHYRLAAGTIFAEAAWLAGVENAAWPTQSVFEALRHTAAEATDCPTAAQIARHVIAHLGAGACPYQTAALIWWFALLHWAVNTP